MENYIKSQELYSDFVPRESAPPPDSEIFSLVRPARPLAHLWQARR